MLLSALYLAAGQSKRMGVCKQALELAKNQPLGRTALHALSLLPLHKTAVVVHPEDSVSWLKHPYGLSDEDSFSVESKRLKVVCEEASLGMAYSIRCGLQALLDDETELDGVLVVLADQPFVPSEWFMKLIVKWSERPQIDFVASLSSQDNNTNAIYMPPAVLSRSMFQSLLALEGDAGARKLFFSPEYKGYGLFPPDSEILFDIDTPSDMREAKKRFLGTMSKK